MADQRTLRVVVVGNASQAQNALRRLGDDADRLEHRTGRFSGGLAAMGGRLAQFGTMAAGGLAVAAGAAAVLGVKTASDMEQATIAFKTLTGSSDKAKQHLNDLKKFAASTPFEMDGLIQSSIKLQGVGVAAKDVIPHLTAWGNAASAVGVDGAGFDRVITALSQAMSAGRFTLQDFNQIANNGIPVYKLLSEAMHKPVPELRKMATNGQLASDKVLPLLEKTINSKWGDAMANQSKTAAGLFSSLSDTVKQALGDMMVAFFPLIKAAIPKLTNAAAWMGKNLPPIFQKVGQAIGPIVKTVETAVGGLFRSFSSHKSEVSGVTDAMSKGFNSVKPVLSALGNTVRTQIIPLFKSIASAVAPVLATIAQVMYGTVIPALMALIQKIMPYYNQFIGFIRTQIVPVLSSMFKQAQPVIQQLGQTIATVMQGIGVAIQVVAPILQLLWKFLGPIVLSTIMGVWHGILNVIKGVLNIISGVVNIFIGIFTGNWSKAWTGIKQVFKGIWQTIVGLVQLYLYGSIVNIFRGGILRLTTFWRGGWTGIKTFFVGIWNAIKGFFSGGMSSMLGRASSAISSINGFFSRGFSAIWSAVRSKVSSVISTVSGIGGRISTVLRGLPGTLETIGRNIIAGLVRGIKNSLGAVLGAAQSIVNHIPGPIRKMMGIHSPSRVMADIGKWITAGLVKGMLSGTKGVAATAKKLHELITKAFKAKKISKGKANSLHNYLHKQDVKLYALAKRREQIVAKLNAATAKLTDLKKAKADMAGGIASSAKQFGAFMGTYDSDQYGDNSASAILARLKGKLKAIMDFRKNLGVLAKRGFGKGIIAEIAQAGPEQGGQMASALLNANGNDVKALNNTYGQIQSQSDALGNQVASNYYDAGIHSVEGYIKGLKAQENALTKAITNMSKAMVKALKKALGIHSPSRVFAGLGVWTGKGFAQGVDASNTHVQAAMDRMAGTRPSTSLRGSSLAAVRAHSGAYSASQVPVTVHVHGNVTAERDLAKSIATAVRDEIVRNGKRNGGRTGF